MVRFSGKWETFLTSVLMGIGMLSAIPGQAADFSVVGKELGMSGQMQEGAYDRTFSA